MERTKHYKQRLFIFDHREMATLILLCVMISLFTFTVGVHYAKEINHFSNISHKGKLSPIEGKTDRVPSHQELSEQSRGATQAIEDTLRQTLHDEVTRTGLKLDRPHQVNLPVHSKTTQSGATSLTELTKHGKKMTGQPHSID